MKNAQQRRAARLKKSRRPAGPTSGCTCGMKRLQPVSHPLCGDCGFQLPDVAPLMEAFAFPCSEKPGQLAVLNTNCDQCDGDATFSCLVTHTCAGS